MRKWLLSVIVVLCLAVSVSAAETVTLEDAGITLTVPDGYDAFYIGMPKDAPQLQSMGYTYEEMMEYLREEGTLLYAVTEDGTGVLDLSVSEVDSVDNYYISEVMLQIELQSWNEGNVDPSGLPVKGKLYPHTQTTFFWSPMFSSVDEVPVYVEIYTTTHAGKNIEIWFCGVGQTEARNDSEIIANMVDGIEFLLPPVKPQPDQIVDGYRYTQKESGVSFYVPANWSSESMEIEGSLERMQMMTTDGSYFIMEYDVADVYTDGGGKKVFGVERWDIGSDYLSDEAARNCVEELGTILSLNRTLIQGKEAVVLEIMQEELVGEETIQFPSVVTILVNNGYRHVFIFWDKKTSPYYQAYENMIRGMEIPALDIPDTVEIAEEDPEQPAEPSNDAPDVNYSRLGRWIGRLIRKIWAPVTAAVGAWIAKIKLKKKKKPADEMSRTEKKTAGYVCPKCGADISPNMRFCANCGCALNEDSENN